MFLLWHGRHKHVDRGIIFVQSLCQVYDVFFDISMQYFMMEMSMFGFCNVVLTSFISLFGVMCPTVLNWVGLVRPLECIVLSHVPNAL